jgi:hypothetical protein
MPVAIEQHVEWIAAAIRDLRAKGLAMMEPAPAAVEAWARDVQDAGAKTLLPTVKHSWYLGANIPGKPQVFMPYAGGMHIYRQICAEIATDGYRGFVRS